MTTVLHNSTTPSVSVTAVSENNPPQLVATLVPDEQRISFWPQHFGLIPQWVTLEPRVFGWMDRLCEDYCGGIWNLYTLNNGGAFMAPEPDDDDDETWVLFSAMNGMSGITIARPEVVNGHTDVICSTSVSHILAVRKSTLLQIDTLIRQLAEISAMTESIGGKTALDWAMKQDFRCGCWLMEKPETAMKAITRNLDREIWRDLMQRSGMLSLMDAQARDTWYRSLEYDNFPEISEANILSTFEQLHQNKDEVFERGVINVFRGLNWNYKTNCPCKFGSKIIVNNLVRWDRWGFHLNSGQQADRLADLERMLYLFSGKPIPDNRENITIHLDDHIQSVQGKEDYEDEMFSIRYFKKGSAHITFRKPELVDRLNDIIAKHYPDMLAV